MECATCLTVTSLCEAHPSKKAKIQHELGKLDGSVCVRGDDGIAQRSGYRARGYERCVRRDANRETRRGIDEQRLDFGSLKEDLTRIDYRRMRAVRMTDELLIR